jgi:hypothetical protein
VTASVSVSLVVAASVGGALSTLTLVNMSGSTQAAGFVTPIFGWVFKKGEVPAGIAPLFKNGTTPQPYSWGLQSYWSDGSLKFASFMLRSTASIGGNGSLAIGVWSGGTAPTTSARTVTEVYTEAMIVNLVGAGSTFGLTGTWGAWLTNDSNNVEQFVYLDGDAGKVWRFLTHVAPAQGGTAHGQLECYHYVAALTAAGGGLGGFRYLPCVAQPWYDDITVDGTPVPKAIRSFTTVKWQRGPTTVPLALGLTAIDFTWTSGISCTTRNAGTPTVSDFYSGEIQSTFNIPCYFTTTGTLPPPLALNTVYYVRGAKNSTTVNFALSGHYGSGLTITGAGTGTHTINPLPTLQHFGRLFMPTVDARWNFFQGAGSMSAEPTIRTKIDQTYWSGDSVNKLSLIPPVDLALVGIADDPTFPYNWTPYGVGSLTIGRSGGGGNASRSDLGAIQGWQAADFLMQSANSERRIRINAYPGVHDLHCLRNSTNRNVVNIRGTAHAGMTMLNTVYWAPDKNTLNPGFTQPPALNTGQIFDQSNNAHKPAFFYWPYLRTGEPQFLDCMIEMGLGGPMELLPSYRNTTGTNPGNYTGLASMFAGSAGDRGVAWGHRDLQCAAAVCPLVMPDGSDLFACINGIAADSIQAMTDVGASVAISGSYAVTHKLWGCYNPTVGTPQFVVRGFGMQYIDFAACFAAAAREDANARTWVKNEADWYIYVADTFGFFCTTTYFAHTVMNANADGVGYPMISSDAQYATTSPWLNMIWDGANNPSWTVGASKCPGPVIANGDKFIFNTVISPGRPSNYFQDTPYYVIGLSGGAFNLTTVLGDAGSIVVPTGSGSLGVNSVFSWYVPATDVAPQLGAENTAYVGSGSYMKWKEAAHLWTTALGLGSPALNDAILDAGIRSGATGTSALLKADPRLAFQNRFGP